MFGLTEASTRRRPVCVGRSIAASSGSVLAGQSFTLTVKPLKQRLVRPARGRLPRMFGTLAFAKQLGAGGVARDQAEAREHIDRCRRCGGDRKATAPACG